MKLRNRIPTYFKLAQFNIQPEDIVRLGLGCDPTEISPTVILMPVWKAEIFQTHVDSVKSIVGRRVFHLEYQGQTVTVIRSGIGAPLAGDLVLALGCTPCEKLIFTGSVGGLEKSMMIGELMVANRSLSGDGFSRYLSPEVIPTDRYLQPTEPDAVFTEIIRSYSRGALPGFGTADTSRNDYFNRQHHWSISTHS
jgi:uridine phosphorylase